MVTRSKDLRSGMPYWLSLPSPRIAHSKLARDMQCDVIVIGAGITGAMTAEALSGAGFKVIMLDKRGPLKGATSATTALLQYEIDTPLTHLQKQIGHDKAMRAWLRSKLALDSLGAKLQSLGIRGTEHAPTLYLSGDILDAEAMNEESRARNEIGLYNELIARKALLQTYGIRRNLAIRSYGNMTVNPIAMTAAFLKAALHCGTRVYAPESAEKIITSHQDVRVITGSGHSIKAKHLIYATGYEIPRAIKSRRFSIHSTYAITTRPQAGKLWPDKAMIWEAADPYLYIRTTADGRVICGGEDEEFENEEKRDALLAHKTRILEKKLGDIFPQLDSRAAFAWCGSFGASATGLPAIGPIPGMKHCYAILAFGGNGITYSRIAAELLTSALTGRHDPDADLFAFT